MKKCPPNSPQFPKALLAHLQGFYVCTTLTFLGHHPSHLHSIAMKGEKQYLNIMSKWLIFYVQIFSAPIFLKPFNKYKHKGTWLLRIGTTIFVCHQDRMKTKI